MSYTFAEIKNAVKDKLDLWESTFIDEEELGQIVNDGVDFVAREVLNLCQDYFLSETTISLVADQSEYDLPVDIFAKKIRAVEYDDGSNMFEIEPIKNLRDIKYLKANYYNTSANDYALKYYITNVQGVGPKLTFAPAPKATGDFVHMFYIRKPLKLSGETDVCDIPEFINVVMQYVEFRVAEKEGMDPGEPMAVLRALKAQLKETLGDAIVDEFNEIEIDACEIARFY